MADSLCVCVLNCVLLLRYDKHGKDALDVNFVDYACVFNILFGSESFEPLIGELMLVTATKSGGELTREDMLAIQKERLAKIAFTMAQMLEPWVEGDRAAFMTEMNAKGEELCKCRCVLSLSPSNTLLPLSLSLLWRPGCVR